MSSDESKYQALQLRLDAIGKIIDPDKILPNFLREILDLSAGANGPDTREFRVHNGEYIIEYFERGKSLDKLVYDEEDDCAYHIVLSMIGRIEAYQDKGRGPMTDERIIEYRNKNLDLLKKIDVSWASKYEVHSEKYLKDTLRRREMNRLEGGTTIPER